MYKKGMVIAIICLFVGVSFGTGVSVNTSTFENIIQSGFDECYPYVEVDDDAPSDWYNDYENHTDGIQEAIDLVCENGTVYVHSGEYSVDHEYGYILINKPLNLIGQDKDTTSISGEYRNDVIRVRSSNVNISGFTIRWSLRQDEERLFAGVHIKGEFRDINISRNILTENTMGISAKNEANNITIYNNTIKGNDYDGIVLCNSNNSTILFNLIYENGRNPADGKKPNGDGIGIWHCDGVVIANNNISENEVDGIWLDASCCYNIIKCNHIEGNNQIGIHFCQNWEAINEGIIEYNTKNEVCWNTIKGNKIGGISIFTSTDNNFADNIIQENGFFGFEVIYRMLGNERACDNNNIFHNNFINNGNKSYIFNFGDIKKYANAVDTSRKNNWDNGKPSECPTTEDPSTKGGNYWSDYEDLYDEKFGDKCDGYGIWEEPYVLFVQILLSGKIRNILEEITKNKFYSITLGLKSPVSDGFSWCRQFGWRPSTPDIPDKPEGDDWIKVGEIKQYSTSTLDLNGENISFKFDWGDGNYSDWIDPIESGITCYRNYSWNKPGNYSVRVKAYDIYDDMDVNDEYNIIDGESEWSECLTVKVRSG